MRNIRKMFRMNKFLKEGVKKMVTPFMFFWSKILPISYENYLSETEILEALRQKVNTVITEVEKIESFLSDELDTHILKEVKSQITGLQRQIDNLTDKYTEQGNIIDKIQSETNDIQVEIENIDYQIGDLYTKYQVISDEIEALKEAIREQYTTLNSRITFAIEKAEKDLTLKTSEWGYMLTQMYRTIIAYVNKYFKELSNTTIYVTSPISAKRVTLQFALEEMAQVYNRGLTARQYRLLNLTAFEYREMYLTAEQYRLYGISDSTSEGHPDLQKCYDLFGVRTEEPMSSVYAIFGDGITADMGNLDITAEQYRELSDRTSTSELDRWGAYILTNQYASLLKDNIAIVSDESTFLSDDITYVFALSMLTDDNVVDTVSLLNAQSAEKAILTPIAEPIMEYTVDSKSYVLEDVKNITILLQNVTYVNGLIMARYHVTHDMVSVNQDDPTDTMSTPITMKVRGITSTK